jgi:predicted amidohydrolase YtcJ
MEADLILINGNVLTMNPLQPSAEALGIKNGRIIKVGKNREISLLVGNSTRIFDCKGKTVIPGFIDTHIHVADFGRTLVWLDLKEVDSIKALQNQVGERVERTARGKWVVGLRGNIAKFAENRYPNNSDLDAVAPNNPVVIYDQAGRIALVNSKGLELAAITKETRDPFDGQIDRDTKTGEPTGILRDAATDLVWKAIPEPDTEDILQGSALACASIVKTGVTTVHWIVSSAKELSVIQKLREQNRLPLRVYIIVPANLLGDIPTEVSSADFVKDGLKVGGVLIFADGFLAMRTAALNEPYSDYPAKKGRLLCNQTQMTASISKILKSSLQVIIHANGDQAVDTALKAIKDATQASGKDHRCRLEQAALLNKELIRRIKEQKLIVSIQPRVIESEFSTWSAREHLGLDRARWLYPVGTLLKEGVHVAAGSDCPMEPLNPFSGIRAAISREFFAQERITFDDALRLYTTNAAYASFEESNMGSIETGKLADFAILSRDPREVPPDEIEGINAEMTIVGGRVVFQVVRS